MTDQLESDLRAALRDRASLVPDASVARLTAHDYRPRTRRLRPPVAIGAVASAAAASGLVLVISLGAGASNAFAGWTPEPTPPAPGQLGAARASCEQSQSPIAGLPLAIADTRGPFTLSIYAAANSIATCIKGPSFLSVSEAGGTGSVTVPADRVLLSGTHRTDRGNQPYGWAYGRTGSGVSAVTLVLDDATKVRATVENGWFVAWWPSSHKLDSAALATPAGTSTQKLDLPYPGPCTGPKCTADSSAGGKAGAFSESGSASGTGTGTGPSLTVSP